MRIGQLDQRIKIMQPVKADDGFNSSVKTASTELAEVSANKRDITGMEHIRAGQEVAALKSLFTIRWRGDVTADMSIVHLASGRNYAIDAPPAGLGRRERQWLQITATAQVK